MQTIVRMALATATFAVVHSALATRTAKRAAGTLVGETRRDAGYRVFYVGQSLLTFGALIAYAASLPKRTMYRITGPAALLLRSGQITGVLFLLSGLREVGFARWSGLRNLLAYRAGQPIPPGPVAQGPEMQDNGRLTVNGPFRWSRHPLNFAGIPIFWLTPHMTTRRFGFNVLSTIYFILGSMHEEVRLRDAYGSVWANRISRADYDAYRKIPFF